MKSLLASSFLLFLLYLAVNVDAAANCSNSASISAPWFTVPSGAEGEGEAPPPRVPFTLSPNQNGFCADGKYLYVVGNVPALNTPLPPGEEEEGGGGENHIRRVSSGGNIELLTEEGGLPLRGPPRGEQHYFTSCDIMADGTMFLRYGVDNAELWMINIALFDQLLGDPLTSEELMPVFSTDYSTWDLPPRDACDVDSGLGGTNTPFYGAFGNVVQDPATGYLYMIGHFCKAIFRMEIIVPGGQCCLDEGGKGGELEGPPMEGVFQRKMKQQCLCGGDPEGDNIEGPPRGLKSRRMATQCGDLLEPPVEEGGDALARPMRIQCEGELEGPPIMAEGYRKRMQRRRNKLQGRKMDQQREGPMMDEPLPGLESFFWLAVQVGGDPLNAGTNDDASDALNAQLNEARYAAFFAGNMYFLDTSGLRKYNPAANFGDGGITTLTNSPTIGEGSSFLEGLNSAAIMGFSSATSRLFVSGSVLVIKDRTTSAVWGVDLGDEDNTMNYGVFLQESEEEEGGPSSLANPTVIYPMGVNSFAVADNNGIRIAESQYPALCYESSASTNVGVLATVVELAPEVEPTPVPPTPVPAGGGRARELDLQEADSSLNKKTTNRRHPTTLLKRMQQAGKRHGSKLRRGAAVQEGTDPESFGMCTDGNHFFFAEEQITRFSAEAGPGPRPVIVVGDSTLQQGRGLPQPISQCDIHGDTMFVSWNGGSVVGRLSLSTGDSFVTPISAHDFDFWGTGREGSNVDRCDGGYGANAKTFGPVGNFIRGGGPTRYFLFGVDCGVLWEFDHFGTETESWIAAGTSIGRDLDPSGPATDSADPTTARIKSARYGAYHQGSLSDQGRIFFLDESGLRKYTIGGGVTTLSASSPTWSNTGYAVGLNSAASFPLKAGNFLTTSTWSQMVIRETNQLYISDPENQAIWMADISDDQNIMWGTAIGGWPVKTGAGATDGDATTGQVESVFEMTPFRDSLAFMDLAGIRTLSGRTTKCAGDVIPSPTSGTCTPATKCSPLTEFETTPKGRFTDRVCAPLTECSADEVEVTAPTATSDRVCGPAATPDPTTTTIAPTPAPTTTTTSTAPPTPSTTTPSTTREVTSTSTPTPNPTSRSSTTTTTIAVASSSSSDIKGADDVLFDPAAPVDGPANAVRADGGLSGGEQAGISLGVILVIVGICCLLGFGIWKYKMAKKAASSSSSGKSASDDVAGIEEGPKPDSQTPPLSARAMKYSPQETSLFEDV